MLLTAFYEVNLPRSEQIECSISVMPLKGIRVIELAGLAPVPLCGMYCNDDGIVFVNVNKRQYFLNESLCLQA